MQQTGDNLVGIGAKARGMSGTGIAVVHRVESGLVNATLITSVENTEISFGGTLFAPTIKASLTHGTTGNTGTEYKSDADLNMIPEVSIAHKINDNWFIGYRYMGNCRYGVLTTVKLLMFKTLIW